MIAGVDEAGRGPLAGPVVAAAVVLCKPRPAGLDDSKKLSAEARARAEAAIKRRCQWAVGVVDVADIDRLNIFGATMLAMTLAVEALCAKLGCDPFEVLVDGNLTPAGRTEGWRWAARPIVGGDAREPCISAASIIAKEHRDRIMRAAHERWPQYDWASNKGYGAPAHLAALKLHGPSPLHRRSFAPVAACELRGDESFGPHPIVESRCEECHQMRGRTRFVPTLLTNLLTHSLNSLLDAGIRRTHHGVRTGRGGRS